VDTQLISILVPVLNEEDNIAELYRRVSETFASMGAGYDFELVFTDNHSSDGTFGVIASIAKRDPRVRVFRFSRNFGFQRSILEGYRRARGAAAVQLDADLQDPPELIPAFVERWQAGATVVYGVRTKRPESTRMSLSRKGFYRLAAFLSEDPLQIDAGDFRLVDRRVIDVLANLQDAQPYLRGAIAAMGFEQIGIPYERAERTTGESKFSLRQLTALSLDGILNHSTVPLRMASYTGLLVAALMILGAAGFLIGRLVFGQEWPEGFATTTLLILLSIALNALFLGIIGEYLGRIYKQVKRGPNTIIESSIDPAPVTRDAATPDTRRTE
jgi:dolichol-phosphate mannosyltransferase